MIQRLAVASSIAFAFALLAPTPARADNASLAEALFRQAREAMRAGNYATACPQFAESQRLDPSSGTRFNLAFCEEHEGRVATAWAQFRAVADELPSTDARVPVAREHAQALEPRLPWLKIVLPRDAKGVAVSVDGTALRDATVGVELPVDPGAHLIDTRVQGAASHAEMRVTLAEGEHRSAVIELSSITPSPAPAPPVARPVQTRAHSSAQLTAGWVSVATGAAAVAAGFVLGALALQKQSVVNMHCPDRSCDPTGLAAAHDGTFIEGAATVSFAVGLAALGAGTYLVLSAPSSSSKGRPTGLSFLGLQGTL